MATDFWASSHFKKWIVDKPTIRQARMTDLKYVEDPEQLSLLSIFFCNLITKLGYRLSLRQRAIATACVFFRRFYLKSSYCETDPFLVIAACCYVASKAEESPVHLKNIVLEARNLFGEYGIGNKNIPNDNTRLAEMEFYLIEDLECDLVVFHPYRTLMALVKEQSTNSGVKKNTERESGELGFGLDDGDRYWGSDESKLSLHAGDLQMAWFLINDTYRSDICLLYPPHLIAIAALYLTCVLQGSMRRAHVEWMALQQAAASMANPGLSTRRSSRQSSNSNTQIQRASSGKNASDTNPNDMLPTSLRASGTIPQDFVGFFASLNVNMRLVATISQDMIRFYTLCDKYKEEFNPTSHAVSSVQNTMFLDKMQSAKMHGQVQAAAQSMTSSGSRSESRTSSVTPGGGSESTQLDDTGGVAEVNSVTLLILLDKMQSKREMDLTNNSGHQVAINKRLERAQAAG